MAGTDVVRKARNPNAPLHPWRRFGRRLERLVVDTLVIPRERETARRHGPPLVERYLMVTGSAGKGTTTQIAGRLLGAYGVAQASGPNNLLRGIFRTLRELESPVEYLVQELCCHKVGAVDNATGLLPLDVAVVTMIGTDHLSSFGSREGIAREKGRLVEIVRPGGFAVLNADDPLVMQMAARTKEKIVTFGRSADADVRAENIEYRWPHRLSFDLIIGDWRRRIQTRFVSEMLLDSILAGIAVVHGYGFDIEAAVPLIESLEPQYQRLSVHDSRIGHTFILDTYKGSDVSTERLIGELPNLINGPTIYVQGRVSHTGGEPAESVIRKAMTSAASIVDHVVGVGEAYEPAQALAGEAGLENVLAARTYRDALEVLKSLPPSLVIIKSSVNAKLQRIWLSDRQPVTCPRTFCLRKVECIDCPKLNA